MWLNPARFQGKPWCGGKAQLCRSRRLGGKSWGWSWLGGSWRETGRWRRTQLRSGRRSQSGWSGRTLSGRRTQPKRRGGTLSGRRGGSQAGRRLGRPGLFQWLKEYRRKSAHNDIIFQLLFFLLSDFLLDFPSQTVPSHFLHFFPSSHCWLPPPLLHPLPDLLGRHHLVVLLLDLLRLPHHLLQLLQLLLKHCQLLQLPLQQPVPLLQLLLLLLHRLRDFLFNWRV